MLFFFTICIVGTTIVWLVGRISARKPMFTADRAARIVEQRRRHEEGLVREANERAARPAPYLLTPEKATRFQEIRERIASQREPLRKAA